MMVAAMCSVSGGQKASAQSVAKREIVVHGHRGARAWRPENTIPAFEFAIEHGVDVLELDLAVTKDNVLVVSHNPTLAPNSFPGERICKGLALAPDTPIHSMALAEVRPDFSLATPEQVAAAHNAGAQVTPYTAN